MLTDNQARMWKASGVEGLELKRARFTTFNFGRHLHPQYVISLPKGPVKFTIDRTRHDILPDNLVILHPGDVHEMGSGKNATWGFNCFYVDESLMQKFFGGSDSPGKSPEFREQVIDDPELISRLQSLHSKLDGSPFGLEEETQLHLTLKELMQRYSQNNDDSIAESRRRVHHSLQRVKEYLEEYYDQNIRLDDLAEVAGLSLFHMLREFKKQFGLPPYEYLNQLRVQRVKEYLRKQKSIADVAIQTGFSDQSHLTRTFKRLTGITPGLYRSSC